MSKPAWWRAGIGVAAAVAVGVALGACSTSSASVSSPAAGGPAAVAFGSSWQQAGLDALAPVSVIDRTVFASTSDGDSTDPSGLAAVDAVTGKKLWHVRVVTGAADPHDADDRPLGVDLAGQPMVVDVEVDSRDGTRLVARAARTGAVRWTSLLASGASPDVGPLVRCGSAVCVSVGSDGTMSSLRAIAVKTGGTRWTRAGDGGTTVLSGSGVVVTSGGGHPLAAYAIDSGRRVWAVPDTTTAEKQIVPAGSELYPTHYLLGHELICGTDQGLTGVDLRTGKIDWSRAGWTFVRPGQPTVGDDGLTLATPVVLAERDQRLYALRPDGSLAWAAAHSVINDVYGTDQLGWSADLSQVWVVNEVRTPHGYRTATGAALPHGLPVVLVPTDVTPGLGLSIRPSVQARRVDYAYVPRGDLHSAPAWAGPTASGRRLLVDPDGALTAYPAG